MSYPTDVKNELEKVHHLLMDDKIDFFHLRKPDFDYLQLKEFINNIDENLHSKVMIHSHFGLINDFDLAGINLNKKALNQLAYVEEVDKCFIQPLVLNEKQIEINRQIPSVVSYSAHSIDEINDLPFKTDYVFLSPIFDSISKIGYQSKFDLKELKEEMKAVNTKIIALGGVTLLNIEHLQSVGFYGYARLGDFWNNENKL